jgi:hypothetical protein
MNKTASTSKQMRYTLTGSQSPQQQMTEGLTFNSIHPSQTKSRPSAFATPNMFSMAGMNINDQV